VPRAAIAITKAFVSLSTECSLRDYLVFCRAGFFFFRLIPRSTRKLIPRFTVVRVLVDPIEQLFAAWLLAPGRLSFRFADHWVRVASQSRIVTAKLNGDGVP